MARVGSSYWEGEIIMIIEKIKEAIDNGEVTKATTGTCQYCGQAQAVEIIITMGSKEANDAAVELCNCSEAQFATQRKNRAERISDNINALFGEESENPVDECVVKQLKEVGKLVAYLQIRKATIDLSDSEKAKFSVNKDSALMIVREKKKSKGILS